MKLSVLVGCVVFLCSILTAAADPLVMPQISEKPGQNGVTPSEWSNWAEVSSFPIASGRTAQKEPFPAKAFFSYDAENLYCGISVVVQGRNTLPVYGTGPVVGYGNAVPVLNDAVQLAIWNEHGERLGITADASGITMCNLNGRYTPSGNLHKVQGRVVKNVGYDLLFTVPWKQLKMSAPEPGKTISYQLTVLEWCQPAANNHYRTAAGALPLVASGNKVKLAAIPTDGAELVDIDAKDPILNFGYPGRNSVEMLDLLKTYLDWKPTLAIVMIGTNDVVWGIKATEPGTYRKTVKAIMEMLQKSGCKVIWVTAPPCIDEFTLKSQGNEHLNGIPPNVKIAMQNRIAVELARQYNIPVVDFWLACARRGQFNSKESLLRNPANSGSRDGVHPTSDGYMVLAEMIAKCIKKNNLPTDRIACYGDSITFGANMPGFNTTVGEVYPAYLRKLLFHPEEK